MNKKVFTLIFSILFLAFGMNSRAESVIIDVNDGSYPDYAKWYYFSFATGEVVGTSDFTLKNLSGAGIGTEVPDEEWAARSDWDIAFHATDIRANEAKALLIADATTPAITLDDIYDSLVEAPVGEYTADEVISGTFIQSVSSMPPPRATSMSACKVTSAWAAYGMNGSSVNPTIVVFELANGAYVKVYLKDFFKKENEESFPGFIEMEYTYIPFAGQNQSGTFTYEGLYAGELSVMGTPMKLPDFSTWHYFSFDEEYGVVLKGTSDFKLENINAGGIGTEVIDVAWQARTDWDFAFHATDIRTNSGAAGNGNAGAVFITDEASANGVALSEIYAMLIEAPNVEYAADEILSGTYFLSLTAGMPPHRTTTLSVCGATKASQTGASDNFATLAMSGGATENPMIVVFKTTKGKYVKVYLKQFVSEDKEPGILAMDYEFISLAGGSGIDNTNNVKFNIYPNPATEALNVELNEAENNSTIVIYSLTGICVKQVSAKAGVNTISVNDLSVGTYFVKAGSAVRKFIVK
jgi:hypothetical protein